MLNEWTNDSNDNIGACKSIVLLGGCSDPSNEADDGDLYVDVVHTDDGTLLAPSLLVFTFVVKTWDNCNYIYSQTCSNLWLTGSCNVRQGNTLACNDAWTAFEITGSICDEKCCYKENVHETCTWVEWHEVF